MTRPAKRKCPASPDPRQAGFTLTELAISVVIIAIISIFGIKLATQQIQSRQDAILGKQLASLASGLTQYVAANYTTLIAQVQTAGHPINIPLSNLTAGQYIDPFFPATNAVGQTFVIYARQPTATDLETMACMNGAPALSEKQASDIVDYAAPYGGWVSRLAAGKLTGVGYTVPLSDYSPLALPSTGNVCVRVYNSGALTTSNYLNRFNTGNPEANTMHTAIRMNSNNITGANLVDTQDVQLDSVQINGASALASRGVYQTYFAAAGTVIPKPTCPTGTSPTIQPAPSTFSDNGVGASMSAVQTTVTSQATNWIINMQVLTQNGWVTPTSQYGEVVMTVNCE